MFFEAPDITPDRLACVLRDERVIVLSENNIRMRDVVDLTCGDGKFAAQADLIVAKLPETSPSVDIDRSGLIDLIKRRVPGMAAVLTQTGNGAITFRQAASERADAALAGPCFAATQSIADGAIIGADNTALAPCRPADMPSPAVYQARYGVTRSARDLEPGEYIGRLYLADRDVWEREQALTLKLHVGPVTIERDVVAVTPNGAGHGALVRDGSGTVFSVPVSALGKPEANNE